MSVRETNQVAVIHRRRRWIASQKMRVVGRFPVVDRGKKGERRREEGESWLPTRLKIYFPVLVLRTCALTSEMALPRLRRGRKKI